MLKHEIKSDGKLLKVRAFGKGDKVEEILDYAKAVILEALKNQSTKILCDERELSHDLDVLDTVFLAEKIKEAAPGVARVAILYDEKDLESGDFYETAAINRGLRMFITSDSEKAKKWLEL